MQYSSKIMTQVRQFLLKKSWGEYGLQISEQQPTLDTRLHIVGYITECKSAIDGVPEVQLDLIVSAMNAEHLGKKRSLCHKVLGCGDGGKSSCQHMGGGTEIYDIDVQFIQETPIMQGTICKITYRIKTFERASQALSSTN